MSGEHVLYLLAFAFLAASAAIDIRSRKLSVAFLAASAAAAAAAGAFLRQDGVAGILLSLLPAAVLLSASIMSRGGIGAGDGCAAAVLGFFTDLRRNDGTSGLYDGGLVHLCGSAFFEAEGAGRKLPPDAFYAGGVSWGCSRLRREGESRRSCFFGWKDTDRSGEAQERPVRGGESSPAFRPMPFAAVRSKASGAGGRGFAGIKSEADLWPM